MTLRLSALVFLLLTASAVAELPPPAWLPLHAPVTSADHNAHSNVAFSSGWTRIATLSHDQPSVLSFDVSPAGPDFPLVVRINGQIAYQTVVHGWQTIRIELWGGQDHAVPIVLSAPDQVYWDHLRIEPEPAGN